MHSSGGSCIWNSCYGLFSVVCAARRVVIGATFMDFGGQCGGSLVNISEYEHDTN